jgi:hypothetical protein
VGIQEEIEEQNQVAEREKEIDEEKSTADIN